MHHPAVPTGTERVIFREVGALDIKVTAKLAVDDAAPLVRLEGIGEPDDVLSPTVARQLARQLIAAADEAAELAATTEPAQ